jgi:predicted esterase
VPSQRFAVEFDRRTVGIAVRVPGGFMFFSSTDAFDQLDGRLFRRVRAMERELRKVAKRRGRAPAQPQFQGVTQ